MQHAKQLHLHRRTEFGDLVQEERSAVRQLESPRFAACSAGEGALLVPEQLGLEEVLRQGGAVDGVELEALPGGQVVDGVEATQAQQSSTNIARPA